MIEINLTDDQWTVLADALEGTKKNAEVEFELLFKHAVDADRLVERLNEEAGVKICYDCGLWHYSDGSVCEDCLEADEDEEDEDDE